MHTINWIGIAFCISQSAMFSGLNLAVFSVSRLRLEVEASTGNPEAIKVLQMREDSNFILTTILWGNVGINVLLTLLSNSVMAGVTAFFFSTFLITFLGEIGPQAYFSRNALRMASMLSPLLKFYQIVLYPAAKPTALVLDRWLGPESIQFFQERDIRQLIKKHIEADEADVDRLEGIGALNFLSIDDLFVAQEGELLDPGSIISLPMEKGRPKFPSFNRISLDPFLQKIQISEKKWVIITDPEGEPCFVLDADGFLRGALFELEHFHPNAFCHRPIIIRNPDLPLGKAISKLHVYLDRPGDDVVDQDIILLWADDEKRIITGADILGRLLRGITSRKVKI